MANQLKREVRDLEPGDHLSLIYRGRDQKLAGLVPLVREALSRGHRCRYLTDRKSWEAIESALSDAGVPVSEERERGRLEISSGRDSFVEDGTFDPTGVDEIFQADLDRALDDGFEALWWISETSWLLGRCRPENVKAMEAHAQEAVRGRPMIVVCQYDRERLDDDAVAQVLAAHPLAILGDEVFPNPFYEPPAVILEEEDMTRADWMIRQLERQREVQARLESREREIATLLQNSPDLVARLDRDHRYLYVNPVVEEFTGRPAEERLGRSHQEIVPDLEPGRPWFDAIDRAFETGREQSVEASFETPQGVRWFETRIVPESPTEAPGRDAPVEDPETVLVVARDITDRIEAEKERRRFEELYRDLFRLSRDGIFITRLDGTIVDLNPACAKILAGESPIPEDEEKVLEEARRLDAGWFYTDSARREELFAALQKGPVQDFPVRVRRLDDSPADLVLSAIPWRNEDGEIIGLKGIVRDVTEENLRRHQLEQTTRLFEKTLSSLDEAVFIVETGTRKVIHCNDAAERMFGYDRSEMIDHATEFLHVDQDHNRRFHEESWEVVESGETFRSEFEMRRKDGSVFPTFHTVAPLDSELGMENAVVSVVRDLTRQKRLERRLREIARQERRRLAHDLHDELGQELTALALQANELRRTVGRGADDPLDLVDELEEGLNKAIQSIRHVARGLLPEELEKRGLAEILEELAGERRRSLGVDADVDVDPGVRFSVEETAHLYRIAQEALLNAFRHGEASSVTIRVFEEDRHRILRVRDDGIGFERSSPGAERNGMGLEVMRHRAEAMGGSLEIESRAGWGTTVTCILPLSPINVTTELA